MPYIAVRMAKGLSLEKKRALVKDITEVAAKDIGCSPQSVVMELEEFEPGNIVESGMSFGSQPGQKKGK